MKHLNNNKKKDNTIVAAAKVLSLATTTILVLAIGVTTMAPLTALGAISGGEEGFTEPSTLHRSARAPVVVSGDNIYIAWWTNNTANNNEEVMFRASNDGGATFGDKINLSNTTDADSWRVEIAGEGDSVVVSWWETNQTSDIPVARVSNDGGETFGAMLRLGANGTLTNTEEGGDGGETTTEEAVGGAEVAE
jgi:hypothetical protein